MKKSFIQTLYNKIIPIKIRHNIHSLRTTGRLYEPYKFTHYDLFKKTIPLFETQNCIFIHIPKTGGISLYSALFDLNDSYGHFPLVNYIEYFNKIKFYKYFKFCVVRNPYERLYSAFSFLKKGGINNTDAIWAKNNLSNFDNFEDFIENKLSDEFVYSYIHFYPQTYFIKNKKGQINMDYIAKLEDINTDFENLKYHLNFRLDKLPVKNTSKSTKYNICISDKAKNKIYNIYKDDFLELGYNKF